MALSKDEVIKIAIGFLDLVRQNYDVRQAYLFGSFAKGVAKDYSDVDLPIVLGSLDVSKESPPLCPAICMNEENQEKKIANMVSSNFFVVDTSNHIFIATVPVRASR